MVKGKWLLRKKVFTGGKKKKIVLSHPPMPSIWLITLKEQKKNVSMEG